MKKKGIALYLGLLFYLPFTPNSLAQNIPNPVVPGVADAGVMKYNGKYYLGGVATNGGFYVSDDLVHWTEKPIHVFDMNNDWTKGPSASASQIHANDINYINGTFHLHWSVNYWGADQHTVHIGHATSNNVLGPYTEPKKDKWIDSRIDPKLFIDDDGRMYMYMVKFTDGNTIWGRPMSDPYTFNGNPVYQFAALPDTWETLDNKVAEGPWVMKYRNRYYMIYNANHTATEWGNYLFGVCEADEPLLFNNSGKYSNPLLQSNQVNLEDRCIDLLRYENNSLGLFAYSHTQPAEGWMRNEFDDSNWKKGHPGFGNEIIKGATVRKVLTKWKEPQLFVRRSFQIEPNQMNNIALRVYHDGPTKVYLNGEKIYEAKNPDYQIIEIKNAHKILRKDRNVIAVETSKGAKNFLNFSLFDLKKEKADDIFITPGQPNVVKGPNGFDYWMVYMANKNREHRGQYINRVHFFGKTLQVEGITGSRSAGYHPAPTAPTFGDGFNDATQINSWNTIAGNWQVTNGELVQSATKPAMAVLQSKAATHYLFEANIRSAHNSGVYAYYTDSDHWLKVGIDPQRNIWFYTECNNGKSKHQEYQLPTGFKADVYHTITLLRNDRWIEVRIDNLPARGCERIATNYIAPSLPALYAEGEATFDAIIYTHGWDEYDQFISGWDTLAGNEVCVSEKGLLIHKGIAVKGDLLKQYEFTAQLDNPTFTETIGAYPIYTDEKNNVKVSFDYSNQSLRVEHTANGKKVSSQSYPLTIERSEHTDIRNSDFIEKQYTFHSPTCISSVALEKQYSLGENSYVDFLSLNAEGKFNSQQFISDVHNKFHIEYLRNNKWSPITAIIDAPDTHPGYDKITFPEVCAEALRFSNKTATDLNRYIYKIRIEEKMKQSYNLRAVKQDNALRLFVDGREICILQHNFAPSRVALFSETEGVFNGIALVDRP